MSICVIRGRKELGEFAEDFGQEDQPGVANNVFPEGAEILPGFGHQVAQSPGAFSPVAHPGDDLRNVGQPYSGVEHEPELEIVIAGNGKGGIKSSQLLINLFSQEEGRVRRCPPPTDVSRIEATAFPGPHNLEMVGTPHEKQVAVAPLHSIRGGFPGGKSFSNDLEGVV